MLIACQDTSYYATLPFPTSVNLQNSCDVLSELVWCCSPKHHHFCIAVIGRAVLPASLIPLVEMLYLVIGTNLQDRISIAQKLTKLLILTHLSDWPWEHSTRYSKYTTSKAALKFTTSATELLIELAHQQGEPFLTIG
jgi:hypothetical protein